MLHKIYMDVEVGGSFHIWVEDSSEFVLRGSIYFLDDLPALAYKKTFNKTSQNTLTFPLDKPDGTKVADACLVNGHIVLQQLKRCETSQN